MIHRGVSDMNDLGCTWKYIDRTEEGGKGNYQGDESGKPEL